MRICKALPGAATLLSLALITTGCATKKYVQQQTTPIQQKVDEFDKKHTQALAQLEAKEQKDLSRVEERAITAENKATDAARAAAAADQKAGQAADAAQNATRLAQANQSKLGDLATALTNIDNLKVIHTEEILFGFNKAALTAESKAKLEQLAQKVSGMNRYAIEVEGFTDKSGAAEYNLALSRRRADIVVRHLVAQNVPLRQIHMVGLGSEHPAAEQAATPKERKLQRRVVVRIYAP